MTSFPLDITKIKIAENLKKMELCNVFSVAWKLL